jgi:hypothetical protein
MVVKCFEANQAREREGEGENEERTELQTPKSP